MSRTPDIDPRERLRRIVDALDDEPPSDEEARETVAALGVDIPALAARIRRLADAPDARLHAYEATRARGARAPEPVRPRDEQLARIRALLARAERSTIAAHFRKLEDAGDEELAAILTSLRDLLEPPDDDGSAR